MISAFIVKNIIMMCSLNLRPGTLVPVDCVDYIQECVIHSPRSGNEAEHYIQCQTQYFTIYNSYASFVCVKKDEVPAPPGRAGPNPRQTGRVIGGGW